MSGSRSRYMVEAVDPDIWLKTARLYKKMDMVFSVTNALKALFPVDFLPLSNDFKPPPLLPPRASVSTNYAVLPGVSGPSAPVDYTPYDQKLQKQFGGLNLEEEEVNSNPMEKKPENNDVAKREGYSYSNYHYACDY